MTEPAREDAAGWDPLTAPRDEVDHYLRALGLDPEQIRADGEALVRRLTGRQVDA